MEFKPITVWPLAMKELRAKETSLCATHRWIRRALASNGLNLCMALLLAAGLPELLHWHLSGQRALWRAAFEPSLVITCCAIIIADLFLRQLGRLPLILNRALIAPVFFSVFGLICFPLYLADPIGGRYHIWLGLSISITWYLLVSVLRGRLIRPVIGLYGLPHGTLSLLPGNIHWRRIEQPALSFHVDAVVVDPHANLDLVSTKFLTDLVLFGVPVYHRKHIEENLSGKVELNSHAENNFGALLPSLSYVKVKRLFDFLVAALLLPVVAIFLGFVSLLIKIDSPGPILFRQERVGYRGKIFCCYKLRTMVINAGGLAYTQDSDPRITRIGAHLRKWRIDELPQILNVALGDMSWIGPRPEAKSLATEYGTQIPFYDYRHAVRPGITGWAAVHQGNVGTINHAREKLKFDFYYIKNYSFSLDFLIILKTIQTIFTGFGSR